MKRYHSSIALPHTDVEIRDERTETFQQSVGSRLRSGWQMLNNGREAIENYRDPFDRLTRANDGRIYDPMMEDDE